MPSLEYTPVGPINGLADFYASGNAQNQINLGRQQVQAATMANDYTRMAQPLQMQLLQGALGGGDDQGPGASLSPPAGAAPAGGGQSLMTGDMPVSADPQTQQAVGREAQAQNVNPEWAMRTHYAESGASKSPYGDGSASKAGAKGPMQLMDATASDLGVNSGVYEDNIRGGVKYLGQMKARYGNPVLASAAYNAGPGKVDDFLAGKGSLPPETVAYVGKVFGNGDGAALLRDAFNGAHGHPIGGVQPTGGLQQVDTAATAAVRQLVAQERYYSAMPDGKGARAAAAIQTQLDNIAGPGGIVDPRTGMVFRVPGSYATRFAASQATKSGEIGPETTLAANKAALERETHAANQEYSLGVHNRTPTQFHPGDTVARPGDILPPDAGPVAPAAAPVAAPPPAPAPPASVPMAAPAVPRPQQVASLSGTPGQPVTANDASGAAPPPGWDANGNPLPKGWMEAERAGQTAPGGSGGAVADVLAGLRAAPPVANPNPLLSVVSPANAGDVTTPQNGLAPPASRPTTYVAPPAVPRDQQIPEQAARDPAFAASPEYQQWYARTVAAGTKVDASGQVIRPDMSAYPPVPGAPAAMGTPTVDNSREIDLKAHERDSKEIAGIADAGHAAQSDQIRIQAMRDAFNQITSGPASEFRAGIARFAQTFIPNQATADVLSRWTNMKDPAIAEEVAKMALKGAGTQERGVLGSRGGYQAMKLFQATNPSLSLMPQANQAILGMQLIGNQADIDYTAGAQSHFKNGTASLKQTDGKYSPLADFDEQWQKQRNPQVYAAAMGALGGMPATDTKINGTAVKGWTNGLSEAEYQRALNIVSRADPNAVVNGKSGRLSMQPPQAQSQATGAPAVGTVMQGHTFLGGDPSNPASWRAVH